MGKEIDLLKNYPKTKRNLDERSAGTTLEVRKIARRFDKDFFDGDRKYGYGGFSYNPRFWTEVVKDFVTKVKPKLLGKEIIRSTAPGQMVVKIVHDELVSFLGDSNQEINLKSNPPVTIMMVGLQGSGKTTTTAKLSKFLEKNNKKKIMMVSLDIYRPAAQEQLKILGEQNNIQTLPIIKDQIPADICRRALSVANLNGSDVIIFDTAGRTQIDLQMMSEIKQIEEVIKPTETILVADSLTGQIAVKIAKEFDIAVNLSSIILTRVDGDARGGAALSLKMTTGCPIKFIGNGEKIDDIEIFHPDRIANRILDMGDVVTLVEKAAENIDHQEAEKMAERLQQGEFDLNDLLSQINQMKKMGGISSMLKFIPGMKNLGDKANTVSDDAIKKQEAIILSMTKLERRKPKMINSSRKQRIAKGSGTVVSEVNRILKQHRKMADMMKRVSKKGMSGLQDLGLPQDFNNQIPPEFLKK